MHATDDIIPIHVVPINKTEPHWFVYYILQHEHSFWQYVCIKLHLSLLDIVAEKIKSQVTTLTIMAVV